MSQTKAQLIDPVDGTIVNADINASAAIAGSKISPNFGSQNITTTGNITSSAGEISTTNGSLVANKGTNNQVVLGHDGAVEISRNGGGAFIDFKNDPSEDHDARIQENNGGFDISGNVNIASGCDVTGAITGTGDLTIDTNTLHVDSSNNRVGIGTASPTRPLHIASDEDLTSFTGTTKGAFCISNNDYASGEYSAIDFTYTGSDNPIARIATKITGGGTHLSFGTSGNYSNGITNEALTIDTNGNVGIGTTSPAKLLDVKEESNGTVEQYLRNTVINLLSKINGTTSAQFGTETSHPLAFLTGNTERMRIQSGGGISFNGDTAAANALDDYEEGTWTPTNTIGLTLTNNNEAYYIKIGKLVMIQFDISFSGASDTSQCGVIQSLPFTAENTTGHYSQGPLPYISTNTGNNQLDTSHLENFVLFIAPGDDKVTIFSWGTASAAARSLLVGRRIRHQMIYKAA